jgi:hypothetical protein
MKRPLLYIIATSLLLTCAAARATAPVNDKIVLESLEQAWVKATVANNRVALDQLLDDAFIETRPSGMTRSKKDVLSAPPPPATSTQSLDELQVQVSGDTAVVTGINHYRNTPAQTPIDIAFTDVFERRGDSWRVISSRMMRK